MPPKELQGWWAPKRNKKQNQGKDCTSVWQATPMHHNLKQLYAIWFAHDYMGQWLGLGSTIQRFSFSGVIPTAAISWPVSRQLADAGSPTAIAHLCPTSFSPTEGKSSLQSERAKSNAQGFPKLHASSLLMSQEPRMSVEDSFTVCSFEAPKVK